MPEEDGKPYSVHELILCAYCWFGCPITIAGGLILIFKSFPTEIYFALAYTFGILLIPIIAAVLFKLAVNFSYAKLNYENLQRSRTNILIGYGLVTLLGNLPRILCFFIGSLEFWIGYGAVIYPITSIVIHLLFNMDFGKVYIVDEKRGVLGFILPLFLIFVMFAPARFLVLLPKNDHNGGLVMFQFFAAFVTIAPTVEFSMILTGGLTEKKDRYAVTVRSALAGVIAAPKEIEVEEVKDPRLECKICLLSFSESSRIPRILRECGHTICEECAKNLLKKNNNMHLFCPHCQTVTVVRGKLDLLSKNHFVLDYLKQMKKGG